MSFQDLNQGSILYNTFLVYHYLVLVVLAGCGWIITTFRTIFRLIERIIRVRALNQIQKNWFSPSPCWCSSRPIFDCVINGKFCGKVSAKFWNLLIISRQIIKITRKCLRLCNSFTLKTKTHRFYIQKLISTSTSFILILLKHLTLLITTLF